MISSETCMSPRVLPRNAPGTKMNQSPPLSPLSRRRTRSDELSVEEKTSSRFRKLTSLFKPKRRALEGPHGSHLDLLAGSENVTAAPITIISRSQSDPGAPPENQSFSFPLSSSCSALPDGIVSGSQTVAANEKATGETSGRASPAAGKWLHGKKLDLSVLRTGVSGLLRVQSDTSSMLRSPTPDPPPQQKLLQRKPKPGGAATVAHAEGGAATTRLRRVQSTGDVREHAVRCPICHMACAKISEGRACQQARPGRLPIKGHHALLATSTFVALSFLLFDRLSAILATVCAGLVLSRIQSLRKAGPGEAAPGAETDLSAPASARASAAAASGGSGLRRADSCQSDTCQHLKAREWEMPGSPIRQILQHTQSTDQRTQAILAGLLDRTQPRVSL